MYKGMPLGEMSDKQLRACFDQVFMHAGYNEWHASMVAVISEAVIGWDQGYVVFTVTSDVLRRHWLQVFPVAAEQMNRVKFAACVYRVPDILTIQEAGRRVVDGLQKMIEPYWNLGRAIDLSTENEGASK